MSFSEIGVVGSGKMGSAIFRLLLNRSFKVVLVAIDQEEAERHAARFWKGLERAVRRGKMDASEAARQREAVRFTHRLEDLHRADLVIEAVFEDYAVKADLFRQLECVLSPHAAMVSNTSSISLEKLATELQHSDRFCGLHFFHPVMFIDLVEVIRCKDTPDDLVQRLRRLAAEIGRKVIVVRDAPGSAINWVLSHYYVEALYILEEGRALPSRLDDIAKSTFYVGPCESIDVIGVDFFIAALYMALTRKEIPPAEWVSNAHLADLPPEEAGGRVGFHVPTLLGKLLREQRVGKKDSKGLYLYDKDRPVDDSAGFYCHPDLKAHAADQGNDRATLGRRLLYSVFAGAVHCLKNGVSSLEEIDLGVREVLLMKEGPFTMMRALGREHLREDLTTLTQTCGRRFEIGGLDFLGDTPGVKSAGVL